TRRLPPPDPDPTHHPDHHPARDRPPVLRHRHRRRRHPHRTHRRNRRHRPAGDIAQHRAYTYRPDGHLTAIDDQLSGPRAFDLDDAGRVTTVHAQGWTETYAYDEAGNQTHATWPHDHPAPEATGPRTYTGTRITRAGRLRYEHDTAGRLTLRQ
ncbi:hypothetical protein AB4Z54_65595, partial [Streptomyces sp. MCAF7]